MSRLELPGTQALQETLYTKYHVPTRISFVFFFVCFLGGEDSKAIPVVVGRNAATARFLKRRTSKLPLFYPLRICAKSA
jgi:hypothetical protein